MDIKEKDIKKSIKVLSAVSGVSMAEMAKGAGDTPQGLNQRLNTGRMQKILDYISLLASACGYKFDYGFSPDHDAKDHGQGITPAPGSKDHL